MKIIVNNLAIEYQDEGRGPIMLFLHGWQNNLHSFDRLVELLSPTWRIIRLDLPGFGSSELPPPDWNLNNYIDLVNQFVKKINIQPQILVGHSFGGRIILKGIGDKTFSPKKIILIGAAGLAKNKNIRNEIIKPITKLGSLLLFLPPFLFWRNSIRKKIYQFLGSDYLESGPMKQIFLNIISENLEQSAKKISCPALLIWGKDDNQTPISEGQEMSRLIKNSQLEIISQAGHFVHQEKTDQVFNLIQQFLS